MTTLAFWAAVAAGFSALSSLIMVCLVYKQVHLDHDRRRKEATLRAVAEVFPKMRKMNTLLASNPVVLGHLTPRIVFVMDQLEFLAVGFSSKSYDMTVGLHMLGHWYCETIDLVRPFIGQIRMEKGHEAAYCDSLAIYKDFEKYAKETEPVTPPRPYKTENLWRRFLSFLRA